jgi:hypothetical protein
MVSDVKPFYASIYSATKTSHTLSKCVLTNYVNLQQDIPIKKLMKLAGKNYNNEKEKHFVEGLAEQDSVPKQDWQQTLAMKYVAWRCWIVFHLMYHQILNKSTSKQVNLWHVSC